MAKLMGKCPRCQGNLYDDHDTIKCLACGWEKVGVAESRLWYQANEDDMVRDLVEMGTDKLLKKWPVKAQHISHLKATVLYKELTGKPAAAAAPSHNELPQLPEFNDNWTPEVQITWLKVFQSLKSPK